MPWNIPHTFQFMFVGALVMTKTPDAARTPALELLKLHFGKGRNGKWAIQFMKAVPLRASGRIEEAFFPVQDELFLAQPSFLGTTGFVLGESIVPIVAQVRGEKVLRCLGTGFFVSCSGLLITAAHVITDPIERQYGNPKEIDDLTWHTSDLKLGVMIPLNPVLQGKDYLFRDIEWATFLASKTDNPLPVAGVDLRLTSDTAICKVSAIAEGIPHQPLAIVQPGLTGAGMAVGRTATAVGYGQMEEFIELTPESGHVVSGNFPFKLFASTGVILERFPNNSKERQVSTPGACFSAELLLPGGMSGSPIFDDEGIYVHGVVSKGCIDENGPERFGYGSMLSDSLGLPIQQLGDKSLIELHRADEHGFPKLSGPGI
jgi:hypothetical protein